MNNLDKQYTDLLIDILENGHQKGDRTGTGTISVFGRTIRHKMSEGFPLLTTKKMAWNQIVTELMWFLRGETNIQSLVKEGNNIWVGDAYKYYKSTVKFSSNPHDRHIISQKESVIPGVNEFEIGNEFTKEEFIDKIKNDDNFALRWGEMGPIYGKQWRDWGSHNELLIHGLNIKGVDQIQDIINELKFNPDSRRLMVSAWNVAEIEHMKLPPCHYGFQVYTRELTFEERLEYKQNKFTVDTDDLDTEEKLDKYNIPKRAISLKWNQRSVDTPLGLPFNIASYGLLLLLLANEVNMVPEELIGDLGDTHIYRNQVDGVMEQLSREPFELPQVLISKCSVNSVVKEDIELVNYTSHPTIKFPLSN